MRHSRPIYFDPEVAELLRKREKREREMPTFLVFLFVAGLFTAAALIAEVVK